MILRKRYPGSAPRWKSAVKLTVINLYCRGLVSSKFVARAFRWLELKGA